VRCIQLIDGDEGYGVATVLRLILSEFDQMLVIALRDGKFTKEVRRDKLLWSGHKPAASIQATSTLGIIAQALVACFSWWQLSGRISRAVGSGGVILHCHSQYTVIVAAMVRLRRRRRTTRIVFHYHSKMSRRLWGLIQMLQVQLVGRIADTIVCVSNAVSEYWRGSHCEVTVVYNAIPPWVAQTGKSGDGIPAGRKAMLIAASLSAEKGHLVAVEALAALRARGCDVELWIAGGSLDKAVNPFAGLLMERIRSLELCDRVRLLGRVDNVRDLARKAWVGLQLRVTPEPCSMWVLEAMEAGLPLIASKTGGTPELVREGIDGLLITPPVGPEQVASAVWRVHSSHEFRDQLSANSRSRARLFSVASFTEGIAQVYERLEAAMTMSCERAGVQ
jgi:glycosyltransferase involved in cell wall biosynthesis